eukprot:TRINITY_DN12267_c0_g3_i2.p1 TRINITY_DN12267_c0_g3~~TRINITY_DN12267_c0_g3_i2.p1  ORF type:complete len:102 (-),score=13.44 TRINITY_DN12267_c0_g3_i2:178-483(-)
MDASTDAFQGKAVPMAVCSKGIRKTRFVDISGKSAKYGRCVMQPKSVLKENKQPKIKTILLNKVLKEGSKSYKFGNVLVTWMNSENCFEAEKFRRVVRTLI